MCHAVSIISQKARTIMAVRYIFPNIKKLIKDARELLYFSKMNTFLKKHFSKQEI